jgi:hypothetical protein
MNGDEAPPSSFGSVHAKIVKSVEFLMISSCSLRKAFTAPSPYSGGKCTSNNPKRQYARSSGRVVCRCDAQDMRCAMLKSSQDDVPRTRMK